jgi:hypothetical protein
MALEDRGRERPLLPLAPPGGKVEDRPRFDAHSEVHEVSKLYVPTQGAGDWRARLADPDRHWRREYSAFETAISWELAARTERGLPPSVAEALDQVPDLAGASLLLALPEHKVMLKGRGRPSQTDVWALLKGPVGLISLAVEGKADESFGETLEAWRSDPSEEKTERLTYLSDILRPKTVFPPNTRYQLLHRAASAVIEARRFGAGSAVMLVQSFRAKSPSFDDYCAFGGCLGATIGSGALTSVSQHSDPSLYLGWAVSPLCSDADIAKATA